MGMVFGAEGFRVCRVKVFRVSGLGCLGLGTVAERAWGFVSRLRGLEFQGFGFTVHLK